MIDKKIFGTAVRSELDSKEIYENMADKTENFVLKEKLTFLAHEEEKHKELLENLFHKIHPGEKIPAVRESIIPKIDVESASMPELLERAMESEKIEEKFYTDHAEKAGEYRDLLLYLAKIERGHYALLEAEHSMILQYPDYYHKDWDTDMIHLGP